MKEIVKVYTECLNANHLGDFVRCSDCGELMLMQIGGTACGKRKFAMGRRRTSGI